MPDLRKFLTDNNVSNISNDLIDSINDVAGPIIRLSFAGIPGPVGIGIPFPIPATLETAVVADISSKMRSTPQDAPGLSLLLLNFINDVNALVIPSLTMNAMGMNLIPTPTPPLPIPPITPVALASITTVNALNFAKAILEWSVEHLRGDPRVPNVIAILPPSL